MTASFLNCLSSRRCQVIAGAIAVWCITFPEDLRAIVQPIKLIGDVISPWLAILIAGGLISWTTIQVCGRSKSNDE